METQISIEELKKAIEKQTSHPYLDKFIDQPVIDENKLFLLTAIFQETSYTIAQQKSFIITSMLVQMALDTHDRVSLDDSVIDERGRQKKKRQLTVLAGDYYSGLYYHLLSNLKDMEMIRILASVIKDINEAKMSVYYKNYPSLEDFMKDFQYIESLLVRRVADYVDNEPVKNYAEVWLLQKKLMDEKETFLRSETSFLFQLIMKGPALSLDRTQAITSIDEFINTLRIKVEAHGKLLPEHFLIFQKNTIHVNSKA